MAAVLLVLAVKVSRPQRRHSPGGGGVVSAGGAGLRKRGKTPAKTVFSRFSDGFCRFSRERHVENRQENQALSRFRRAEPG
jgi:hypothetical protein